MTIRSILFFVVFTSICFAGKPLHERLLNVDDPGYNDALDEMSNLNEVSKSKLLTELTSDFKTKSNPDERANAILAIGDLSGQMAERKRAVEVLLLAMKDKHEFVRQGAISGLQRSGSSDSQVIAAFTAALDDKNQTTQAKALSAFRGLGAQGKAAAPKIRKFLKHKDESMQDLAKMALEAMGLKP